MPSITAALAAVLPRCQWLAIACPLTAETRRLIDADMLAKLPAGARIVNIARGEIIDEAALIAALNSGHIAGAYLDVFEKEPLPPESSQTVPFPRVGQGATLANTPMPIPANPPAILPRP